MVAEFIADSDGYVRKPDAVLKLSGDTWAKIYLSQVKTEELIKSGDLKVTGDAAGVTRLINLFDRYDPKKAVVIPPTTLVQGHM